ncbi:MAG: glycerophosphodiester phosphodiesterase [Oscillospiraceae bacterium]|nr:glycerophosphodiester phosphodiesterase [Oscillospiraceae bacterium]
MKKRAPFQMKNATCPLKAALQQPDAKGKLLLCLGAAAAVALPIWLLAPGSSTKRQRAPFNGANIAHRGLHSRDKSVPENSLEAFRLAAEAGYGMELDVQLTRDGQVVVFHDNDLERVCGVLDRVDEWSFEELQTLGLCGTAHKIPLFSQVLDVVHGRTPLIVELKSGRRNKELCEKTYALLENYRGEVCVESFDPSIVAWFRRHGKDLLRGQLSAPTQDFVDDGLSKVQGFVLSRCMLNFLARPQFIAYKIGPRPLPVRFAEWLGAMKVGWTSHEPRNEKGRDTVIFEFYKPKQRYK